MRLNERLADSGFSLLLACESRKKLRVVGIYFAEQPPLGDSRLLGIEVGEKKLIFELRGGELLGGIFGKETRTRCITRVRSLRRRQNECQQQHNSKP